MTPYALGSDEDHSFNLDEMLAEIKNNTLTHCVLPSEAHSDAEFINIFLALETNTSVKALTVMLWSLSSKLSENLAKTILRNKSIEMLCLGYCFREHEDYLYWQDELVSSVHDGYEFDAIDNANEESCKRFAPVCNALIHNKTIRSLMIIDSDVRPSSAELIAKLLSQNSTVEEVDLSYNCLYDEGAAELAAKLKDFSLRKLNIKANLIGQKGLIGLANALENNKTLLEFEYDLPLDPYAGYSREELQDKIAKLLARNKKMATSSAQAETSTTTAVSSKGSVEKDIEKLNADVVKLQAAQQKTVTKLGRVEEQLSRIEGMLGQLASVLGVFSPSKPSGSESKATSNAPSK